MQIKLLIKTVSFRLVAVYAALFSVSVLLLAAVVYFRATAALDAQIRNRVEVEAEALQSEYASGGLKGLKDAVSSRRREHLVGGLEYGLFDTSGRRIFGALSSITPHAGWKTFWGPPDGDEPPGQREQLAVLVVPLGKSGLWLSVADDVGRVNVLGTLIITTFGWALVLFLGLAVIGGLILSSQFLSRIDAVNDTASRIIAGDLKQRIPRRGVPDDLDRLAATLNLMLDRIGHLVDTIQQVSNDVAHDLRTPIGRLRQRLEYTARTATSVEEYRSAVETALTDVDSIMGTFGAILRLAQIESGSRRAGFKQVDLGELLRDTCDTFRTVAEGQSKAVELGACEKTLVDGDPELLIQLVANLMENAITHTPKGTRISATLTDSGSSALLVVSDDGPGVPSRERENIFKRFYRVGAERSLPGNGLGLSIVSAIAELHGAHCKIMESAKGFSIGVEFPLARASAL